MATMRNIPDAHPLYKLLQPHYHYTIGINTAAIKGMKEDVFDIFDEDVKGDTAVHVFPEYHDAPDGHGFPDKMESHETKVHPFNYLCSLALLNMLQLTLAIIILGIQKHEIAFC